MNLSEHIITSVCNYLQEASCKTEWKSKEWWAYIDALTICEDILADLAKEREQAWEKMKHGS